MYKSMVCLVILLAGTPLSVRAMTVVGPQFSSFNAEQYKKENERERAKVQQAIELERNARENDPLISQQEKTGSCIGLVACSGLLLIIAGLGIVFPILYCGQPGYCSNSTLW